ncbi:MAG TPA: D-alanyl-D-alanine carboxypeptidase/D-alanyl-D-alanine-endopeptidase, partial [bacterium (Candidatus Stahlbacteria)]|nr:D-alanyl-D-alanine carboxypeptidase/D-alanyl-D-alanine-endopeptidase [Candidatus Stahlbacteria bacterium]
KLKFQDVFIEPRVIHGLRYPWGWSWHYLDAAYAPRITGLILDGNTFKLNLRPGKKVGDTIEYDFMPKFSDITIENNAITFEVDSGFKIDLYRELGSNRIHIYGGLGINYPGREIPIALVDPLQSHCELITNLFGPETRTTILDHNDSIPEIDLIDSIASPQLFLILKEMNYNSENLYAEAIINVLGQSDTTPSSLHHGIQIEKEILSRLGIDTSSIAIYDGSGLSRFNRITPLAMIKLLYALYHSRYRDHFLAMLPYGGKGTLWYRFKQEGPKVRCKTGTIYGVSCLSGYLLDEKRKIAFTIMINDYLKDRKSIERWQEYLCRRFLTP